MTEKKLIQTAAAAVHLKKKSSLFYYQKKYMETHRLWLFLFQHKLRYHRLLHPVFFPAAASWK